MEKKKKIFRITDAILCIKYLLYVYLLEEYGFCLFYEPPRGGSADKKNRAITLPAQKAWYLESFIFVFRFFFRPSFYAGRKSFNAGSYRFFSLVFFFF